MAKLTMADIRLRLDVIRKTADDNDAAHVLQDELYTLFISHVADVAGGELADMARAVLTAQEIEFTRWYA